MEGMRGSDLGWYMGMSKIVGEKMWNYKINTTLQLYKLFMIS